jgi:hypothetical protein
MSDREVTIGATYRHWTGELYEVLAEVELKTSYKKGMAIRSLGYPTCETDFAPGDIAVVYGDSEHKYVQGTMYFRFERVG